LSSEKFHIDPIHIYIYIYIKSWDK